jgi:hypothetical protein
MARGRALDAGLGPEARRHVAGTERCLRRRQRIQIVSVVPVVPIVLRPERFRRVSYGL